MIEYSSYSEVFFTIITLELLWEVENICKSNNSLLIILFKPFILNELSGLCFHLTDHNEGNNDHEGIKEWINHAEVDQVLWFIWVQLIDVLVQAAVVKHDHQE